MPIASINLSNASPIRSLDSARLAVFQRVKMVSRMVCSCSSLSGDEGSTFRLATLPLIVPVAY